MKLDPEIFILDSKPKEIVPFGNGLINDTYKIVSEKGTPYLVQRKNKTVFNDIPAMMRNIDKVSRHIQSKGGMSISIIHTLDGKLYHLDADNNYWICMPFITDTISYEQTSSTELSRMGGMGIGKFQAQLADFTEPLEEVLPGFHDIEYRLRQWQKSLDCNVARRKDKVAEEISWIESRREPMLRYWQSVRQHCRVTHNDTKINNVLFYRNGEVACVIDLDTVMKAPVGNDFGDSIRTYANTGTEDGSTGLDRVGLSIEMFEAFTDGYLSQQAKVLSDAEIDSLAYSCTYITYEQTLRFLMDYLDGDSYYRIEHSEHNLQRTHAQYHLLRSMEAELSKMQDIISQIAKKYRQC